MFALWYGSICYSQYKNILWEKLRKKTDKSEQPAKGTSTTSKIPVADPKIFRPASPQPPPKPAPKPQEPVKQPEPAKAPEPAKTPAPVKAPEPVKLEPPAKPPRSPSPHPLRTEAFEEIEYEDDEEDEEEEVSTDGEEDSVISSSPRRNQINSTSNEQRHKN